EHHHYGEEQRGERERGDARDEHALIPFFPLERHKNHSAQNARGEGDAKVDHHTPEYLDHSDGHYGAFQAEIGWQHGDEKPGVEAVEEDLGDAVEGDEPGGGFVAPLG